jgi:hypothetical protein
MRRILAVFLCAALWGTAAHAQNREGAGPRYKIKPTADSAGASVPWYKAEDSLSNHWLYAGLRGGGSFRFYTLPELIKDYHTGIPDLSYEAALHAAFRFLPFMSVQAEAVFTQDRARFQGPEYYKSGDESWFVFYTDSYTSTSLQFPLTLKFPLVFDPYIISPFGGVYVTLPLGKTALRSNRAAGKSGDLDYDLTGYLGYTTGVDLGMRLGPGILFLDARYGGDFGETAIHLEDGNTLSYTRSMLSLSVGYELALIRKGGRARGK